MTTWTGFWLHLCQDAKEQTTSASDVEKPSVVDKMLSWSMETLVIRFFHYSFEHKIETEKTSFIRFLILVLETNTEKKSCFLFSYIRFYFEKRMTEWYTDFW